MIYIHSLGRACRYYTQRTTLVVDGVAVSFKALHERVQNNVAALAANGFEETISREPKEVDGEKIYC